MLIDSTRLIRLLRKIFHDRELNELKSLNIEIIITELGYWYTNPNPTLNLTAVTDPKIWGLYSPSDFFEFKVPNSGGTLDNIYGRINQIKTLLLEGNAK